MNEISTLEEEISLFVSDSSICVVIVSYKSGELVINALKSLVNELIKEPMMKVIVVDNSCGEDARIINESINLESWSDWARVAVSPKNGGFSYGNNIAIRSALKACNPPKYIWLLNPDTEIYPDAGVLLRCFLDSNQDAGIVGSCLHNDDGAEWGYAFRFPTIVSEIEQALEFGPVSKMCKTHIIAHKMGSESKQVDWIPGASMMVRTEVFVTAGLFDENYFLYYEETDFCLNALKAGWYCWYHPSSKVMHIAGQSTGATGRSGVSKRQPKYIYDSRYHYFTKNHGFIYTMVTDLLRIGAIISNKIVKALMLETNNHRPYLLRDNLSNFSIIKLINRLFSK